MYKIVFVDDEAITLRLLECVLDWESLGITVAGTASDGKEALELCRRISPDIIIADIRMPGMTGVMLSEMIRKSDRDCKIIFLSAYAEFEYAQSAIANKVSGYLLKPLDEEQLEILIKNVTAELDREKEEKQSSAAARNNVQAARMREAFLRRKRGEKDDQEETMDDDGILRAVCFLPSCPVEQAYLSGTEEMVREAVKEAGDSDLLVVPVDPYEVFLMVKQPPLTTDRISMMLKKGGMRGILGSADRGSAASAGRRAADGVGEADTVMMMLRAESAADSAFFTGKDITVWRDGIGKDRTAELRNRDFEEQVNHLLETGDDGLFKEQLHEMIGESVRGGVRPESLFSAVQDVLIQLKSGIVRSYPDTDLASEVLRHIDVGRLRACLTPEGLTHFLDAQTGIVSERIREQAEGGGASAIIRKARFYAAQHACEEDFSLQKAADYVSLSRNHFSKVFHDGTGVKFWDYVTELRIRNAKKLLAETDLPMAAVAEQAGYETEAHFNRKFKQLEGISPGQYRKRYGR